MTLRRLLVLALASLLVACGSPVAISDAGPSGTGTGGGSGADAGTDLVVHFRGPTAARRGPIGLEFDFNRPLEEAEAPKLIVRFESAPGVFTPITLLSRHVSRDALTTVWDSFNDVAVDKVVSLEVLLEGSSGRWPFTVDVRNAPDTARVLLVAHPSMDLDGGGSAPRNDEASALRWENGAVVGAPLRVKVGRGPEKLRPAPHGRATACLNDFDGTVSIVGTPLTATLSEVKTLATLTLPHGYAQDVVWSRDGRALYVVGSSGDDAATQPASLWVYRPLDDLSQFFNPVPLATFDRPLMNLAVERTTGVLYVVQGQGASAAVGRLSAVKPDGTRAAPDLDTDVAVPNDFAISPAGGVGFVSSDLFGNELIRYSLGSALVEVTRHVPTKEPFAMVFHPGSTAQKHVLLVSSYNKNAVTPYVVTPTDMTPGTAVTGLSLAAELDMVERGPDTGVAFVSALSAVGRVKVDLNGTATRLTAAYTFPSGTTNTTGAVGMQR